MTRNEWLARRLVEQGLLAPDQLSQLWPQLGHVPDGLLARTLVELGRLPPQAASALEQELTTIYGSGFVVGGAPALTPPPSSHGRPGGPTPTPMPTPMPNPTPPLGAPVPTPAHGSGSRLVAASSGRFRSSRNMLQPGAVIGTYVVLEELSRGGMGVVSRVRGPDGKDYAMKTLVRARGNEREVARFEREATVLGQLAHPGVVRMVDHGVEDGTPWFVMSLVEGRTLHDLVQESLRTTGRPPDAPTVLEVMEALAAGLAYCHDLGVVHRDLKPSNVVLEQQSGRPILIDFGLVKGTGDGGLDGLSQALSKTGEMLGTPAFMSPEQLEAGPISAAADVWAFGATLVFCLTGRELFQAGSQAELQAAIVGRDAPRLRSLRPDLSPALDELCAAMLNRDASARPSMREVELRLGEVTARSTAKRLPWLLAGLLMIAVLVGGIGASGVLAGPPELHLEASSLGPLKAARVTIRGRTVNLSGGVVRCGDAEMPVDAEGRFALELEPEEGEQQLTLEAAERSGGPTVTVAELTLVIDRTAPSAVFEEVPARTEEAAVELRGKATEACRVTLGERSVETAPDGDFALEAELALGLNELEVTCTDPAGNVGRSRLRVLRRAVHEVAAGEPWPELDQGLAESGTRSTLVRLGPGEHRVECRIRGDVELVGEDGTTITARNRDALIVEGGSVRLKGLRLRPRGRTRRVTAALPELGTGPAALRVNGGEVRVEGCRFVAGLDNTGGKATTRDGGIGLVVTGSGSKAVVVDSEFQDLLGFGMVAADSAAVTVRKSRFEGHEIAMMLLSARPSTLENLVVRRIKQLGLFFLKGSKATVTRVSVSDTGSAGLVVSESSEVEAFRVQVRKAGQSAFRVNRRSHLKLRDCGARESGWSGVEVNAAEVTLKDVQLHDSKNHGLFVGASSRVEATGLVIDECGKMGIAVAKGSWAVVRDAKVSRARKFGVAVANKGSYLWLGESEVTRCQGDGVLVDSGATAGLVRVKVMNNTGFGLRKTSGMLEMHGVTNTGNVKGPTELKGAFVKKGRAFKPRSRPR